VYWYICILPPHKKYKPNPFSSSILLIKQLYSIYKCLLVKFWRAQGFRVIFYLDDGWGVESDFDSCSLLSNTVRRDLLSAGFFINWYICILPPHKKYKPNPFSSSILLIKQLYSIYKCLFVYWYICIFPP
jgi:hypothetical protein